MSDIYQTKINEYKEYIKEHLGNVNKAFKEFINNDQCLKILHEESNGYNQILDMIKINIDNHDASKYSDIEFDAYRKTFYSVDDKEKEDNKESFAIAWKHHYENNLHHWDSWVEKKEDMPTVYVVEMICDWQAMSYKFGGNAAEWYNKEKGKIILTDKTRKLVESFLDALRN